MKILSYYYNENNRELHVEFTEKLEIYQTYRQISLDYQDIKYYSPTIVTKEDLQYIDEQFIEDLLIEYFKENDLPEEEIL